MGGTPPLGQQKAEEGGAAQSPSTCAGGRQEEENLCGKSSPGRKEGWVFYDLFLILIIYDFIGSKLK